MHFLLFPVKQQIRRISFFEKHFLNNRCGFRKFNVLSPLDDNYFHGTKGE
jgi:hypothetical protein